MVLYALVAENDERRTLTDREILEKYVNLEISCLPENERENLIDMLYSYKEAFSLRNEIGT